MKYKKWRNLEIDPLEINFKNIKLKEITGYMPAGNDVIEVMLEDGQYAYIKIERSKVACFKTEVNNINIIKTNGYYNLVPDILEYQNIDNKDIIVLKKIEGKKLSEVFSKIRKQEQKNKYLYKYGQELAKIHSIPCDKFDIAKQRPINEKPDIKEYDLEIKKYIEYLNKKDFKKEYNTFIHGDFHYGNVLFRYGKINGIIDYEYSGKGLKEQDIAWAIVLRPGQKFMNTKEEINAFLEGYKSIGAYDKEKLKWCLVNGYIHFYLMNKNNHDYRKSVINLLELIN